MIKNQDIKESLNAVMKSAFEHLSLEAEKATSEKDVVEGALEAYYTVSSVLYEWLQESMDDKELSDEQKKLVQKFAMSTLGTLQLCFIEGLRQSLVKEGHMRNTILEFQNALKAAHQQLVGGS